MRTKIPITSMTIVDSIYDMAASIRGTNVLTVQGKNLDLPDVSDSNYTTILSNSYKVEDVGFVEVLSMALVLDWLIKGNGQWRWQISGNGGNTWTTITEITDNQPAFLEYNRGGAGLWISSIDVGTNKLQIRLQARAIAGTVNTQIFDTLSYVRLLYRKWVLT